MGVNENVIITTNRVLKLAFVVFLFVITALIICEKKQTDGDTRITVLYYISLSIPFFSSIILISVLMEMRRGYAIRVEKYGLWFGYFSIVFFIPWDAINEIKMQDKELYHFKFLKKSIMFRELVISYKPEKRMYQRKVTVLDHVYNFVIPFMKNELHISDRMIHCKSNVVIDMYRKDRFVKSQE